MNAVEGRVEIKPYSVQSSFLVGNRSRAGVSGCVWGPSLAEPCPSPLPMPQWATALPFVIPSEAEGSAVSFSGTVNLAWANRLGLRFLINERHALVGRQISSLLTSLARWTGAPGSHQRTWEEKDGGEAPPKLLYPDQGSVTPAVKACEKNHFQPRYAGANLGHPSRGKAWRQAGKAEDERTANRQTELKSFLF